MKNKQNRTNQPNKQQPPPTKQNPQQQQKPPQKPHNLTTPPPWQKGILQYELFLHGNNYGQGQFRLSLYNMYVAFTFFPLQLQ